MNRLKASEVGLIDDLEFNCTNCEKALKCLKNDKIYGDDGEYKIIKNCLKEYPENDDENIIAMKICLIDTTNSTQIFKQKKKQNLNALVKRIKESKFDEKINIDKDTFDEKIRDKEKSLISEISKFDNVNFISFASKYCYYHNFFIYEKCAFVKFDNINAEFIPYYCREKGIDISNNLYKETRNRGYEFYYDIVDKLINTDKDLLRKKNKYELFDAFMWYKHRNLKWDKNQKKFIEKEN